MKIITLRNFYTLLIIKSKCENTHTSESKICIIGRSQSMADFIQR